MAEERFITPEKQLLKLIEEPRAKNTVALEAQAFKHRGLSFFSLGAWLGRFSFFKEGFKKWLQVPKASLLLDIRLVNKILLCCVFVLGFYFLNNFFISLVNLKKMPDLAFKPQEAKTSAALEETSFLKKTVSYYLEAVRQRDIFRMGAKKLTDAEAKAIAQPPSSRIIEATQNLRLVGISWSNDPDVMIEDTKALRTFFVKRGQMIGEVKVRAIFKDKIILAYGTEEIELR